MANDGQVVFEITADNKKALQRVHQVTEEIQKEGKKWDQSAAESTEKIGGSFSGMLAKVAAGLAAAKIGQVLFSFSTDAIQVASSLQEVQNVVDTTFGDGASQIEAWASKAGTQFGLTELQAKKFTSTLGAMMKSAGLAGPEIIQMSTDLSGLAADMASFYNLDFEEAFQKIRAGISGETEPLKQLGVNMSVANLEAFALSQGITKAFNSMSQGEQTMLRYQYLMQATSDAQGDFAKTADSFENAKRRITTAVDQIKSSVGKVFLDAIGGATSAVAGFLEKITSKPERTVLDDFNDIEVDTAEKMADLEATYAKAESIIKLIEEISTQTVKLKDGSTVTFEDLFKDLGNVEKNGGNVRGYIESLGLNVDDVIQKYNVWKESTRQLTSLIPSLSNVIDEETGSIDGGTEALQKNLDEWRATQEKKIAWAAYYAKEQAVAEKKGSMYLYEFDAGAARQAAKRVRDEMQKTYGAVFDENGAISYQTAVAMSDSGPDSQWFKDVAEYNKLLNEQWEKEKVLTEQSGYLEEAEQQLADGKIALIEKYGEEEKAATDAGDAAKYAGKSAEEWTDALKSAPEAAKAIQAVVDYYNKVRDATEQAVNSTIKGFERIKTAWDEYAQLSTEETDVLNKFSDVWDKWGSGDDALKKMAESQDKLTDREKEAYEALVKIRDAQIDANNAMDQYRPEGMKQSLQSQIEFMQNYLKNIEQLKEWGVSDDLIASLSDGSVESANYLQGLAQGGKDAAVEVGELYDQVTEKKKSFVDALTEQKLTADEAFGSLMEVARDAVEALDLGAEAADAMGDTVLGIASGISSNVPAVSSAVAELMSALSPLSSLGFSWGFSGGSFTLDIGNILGNLLNGEFETGLDRVPFDGFLASLHEGEGILTAEENRIWQRFKNGDASHGNVDYETLGGVMRDNVHAGGNVYLDGRTVGQVVSGIQGRSYRNLQRSGWQG